MSSLVVVSFAVGLLVLCILAKILSLPLKLLWKFIANSVIGAIMVNDGSIAYDRGFMPLLS